MQYYEVGGSIRDQLLGLQPKDQDWVVVGGSPEQLLDKGFRSIGKEFPVFQHPQTKQEYALARLERKVAEGHKGFVTQFSPDVTLEQDLLRRDLTINAMARQPDGTIIDPYNGTHDMQTKRLRHVSKAFIEDPLRVFRVARFQARFAHLGFTIAPQTLSLMTKMTAEGALQSLPAERVWQETQNALTEQTPTAYFRTLYQVGALKYWFSEVHQLFGIPQPCKWHPEIDCGVHSLMVLESACQLSQDPIVRFCALVHDVGKGTSNPNYLPAHRGHELRGVPLVGQLAKRLKIPKAYLAHAKIVTEYHGHIHKLKVLKDETCLRVLEAADAFRRPAQFDCLTLCSQADSWGRPALKKHYPQRKYWHHILAGLQRLNLSDMIQKNTVENVEPMMIAEHIKNHRLKEINRLRKECV